MFEQLRRSEFVRSVVVLMTGTVLAQLISYLIYPLLTRIYSEEDFGELGMYTRIVGFVAGIATARYELSLPIAKQDLHAFYLYRLSFRIALVVLTASGLIGLGYFLIQPFKPGNFTFLLLTIVSAYVTVWINLGTYWSVRMKAFRRISQQRVVNSLTSNFLRLGFGLLSMGAPGMLLATTLATIASSFVFVKEFFSIRKFYAGYAPAKRMRVLGKQFKQFPTVNLPHVLLDLGIDVVIAFMISQQFGKAEFGFYSHAYAMLRIPLGLFGQSIGQVFFNKCSEMVNKGQSVLSLLLKTYSTLFLISIVPFTLLFFFGEELFAFVFSEKFRESGRLAEIMVPSLMLNFILSPVSSMPLIFGRQRAAFLMGIVMAAGQLVIFGVLPLADPDTFGNITILLWSITGFQVAVFIFNLFMYIRFARKGRVESF